MNTPAPRRPMTDKPKVAWSVTAGGMEAIVFAQTRARAQMKAAKSYWEATEKGKGWPCSSAHRCPQFDGSFLAKSQRNCIFDKSTVEESMGKESW